VVTKGVEEYSQGYEVEVALPRPRFHGREITALEHNPEAVEPTEGPILQEGESINPIYSLILCVKSFTVVPALLSIRHRLLPSSVILFLQNGMGAIDEVNELVFPDPATRPYYILGINSHGVNNANMPPNTTNHAGFGTIALSILPHSRDSPDPTKHTPYAPTPRFRAGPQLNEHVAPNHSANPDPSRPQPMTSEWPEHARHLLRTLLRTPVLCATAFSPPDILQLQLEKLAVNSVINPLTVLLDARNGAIIYNYALTRVARLLLAETSLVFRSLPELSHIPNVEQRFGAGRLETLVVGVANGTAENISSMLADVRAGRRTEIKYINGWIVKRGEELGVSCVTNFMIKELVNGKSTMIAHELSDSVPFVGVKGVDDGKGDDH
jgi:2-dehydropantoate 2-reductase